MANGRNPGRKLDTGRDGGGFLALPWSVLDSAAYMGLSPTAKALLIEVARPYHRNDNGRMLLSRVYMVTRGWFSAGAVHKAKAELLAAGLIFETVKGCRPNKASWYACTWRALDNLPGYDMDAERAFERSAYRKTPPKEKRPPPDCRKPKNNAVLIPATGTESAPIGPATGTETSATVPAHGTVRPVFAPLSVPCTGIPLDSAISGAGIAGSPLDPDPACKDEKAGAPLEKASAADRAPKPPAGDMADYELVTETLGNLIAICSDCEAIIYRRVSLAKLEQIRGQSDITMPQAIPRI